MVDTCKVRNYFYIITSVDLQFFKCQLSLKRILALLTWSQKHTVSELHQFLSHFFNTIIKTCNQIFDLQCWTEKFFHNNFDWQHARNVQKENSSTNFLFQTHRKWTTSSEGFLIIKGTSSDRQKVLWTFSKKLTKMDILKTLYINVGKCSLDLGRDIRFVKIWPS